MMSGDCWPATGATPICRTAAAGTSETSVSVSSSVGSSVSAAAAERLRRVAMATGQGCSRGPVTLADRLLPGLEDQFAAVGGPLHG